MGKIVSRGLLAALLFVTGCQGPANEATPAEPVADAVVDGKDAAVIVEPRPDVYAEFALTADLSGLTNSQRDMLVLLIEASQIMDDLFGVRRLAITTSSGWPPSVSMKPGVLPS